MLVFLHGGAFIFGAGRQYNGANYAERDGLICVILNYRLGAFGWLLVDPMRVLAFW